MPTYVYRCAKCGEDLEVYQTFSEKPLTKHTGCGGKLTKVFPSVGIVLKGSGFYKIDNRDSVSRKKAREDSSSPSASAGDSSSSSDSGSSDSSSKDTAKSSGDKKSSEKNGATKSSEKKTGEKKSPVKSA